jgi:hypothetical protein
MKSNWFVKGIRWAEKIAFPETQSIEVMPLKAGDFVSCFAVLNSWRKWQQAGCYNSTTVLFGHLSAEEISCRKKQDHTEKRN